MNAGAVSKSTTLSPSSNSKARKKSPPRPDPDRIKSSKAGAAGASGVSAARSLHSHGGGAGGPVATGAARRISGRSEEVGHSDGGGGRSTIGCSGARHAGPGPTGPNRRISTDSMRGDRVKADHIKFDQVKFDSAKFGHQVSSGSKAVVVWTANLTNPSRRTGTTGSWIASSVGSSNRFQSISTKSTASYVAAPEKPIGHASVTSSTVGHASVTSSKQQRPHLQASASSVSDHPSQSSVIVVLTKNRRREEAAVVSSSDSMVRTSPGVFRLLNAPSKVRASSKVSAHQLSTTTTTTLAGYEVQGPEVYGKVCRKETGSIESLEGGGSSFRQICSSASYTLVLDRQQRERVGERSGELRGGAADHRRPLRSDAPSKQGTATSAAENVTGETEKVKSSSCEVGTAVAGGQGNSSSEVKTVVTKPEKATSELDRATGAADAPGRERSVEKNSGAKKPLKKKAIVCEPRSPPSAVGRSPRERAEFQEERSITDFMYPETANDGCGGGATVKIRLTKPSCVSETLAVDHFRLRLAEERTMTSTLRRKLGAVRKDLTKSRTDLHREEELRKRAEQWAEYLEKELESYVRSRAEAEKRYLNLLQVVRGIDRFTKQLLHKYVALHRKIETGFDSVGSDRPAQIHRPSKPPDSPAAAAAAAAAAPVEEEASPSDPTTAVRAEAAETGDKCPPSTEEDDDTNLDHLTSDDYDFITKYLKASASLPEMNADVDSVGLYPEADECDTEANWSSNNFVSFCEASRSLDETGRTEEQEKSIHVLESVDVAVETDGQSAECAGDNKGLKTFDVRLRRLGKFFDQVVRICRKKPEAYFRLLADKSCLLADEIRLSVEEKKRRSIRSERQHLWQTGDFITKDFIFQVRSHGAGDLAEGMHIEMENANGCHEHLSSDLEDELNWEEEEEEGEEELKLDQLEEEEEEVDEIDEKKQHEKEREEKIREQKKLEAQTRLKIRAEKKREEKKREEKIREEMKLEEKKREEKKLEEKIREEKIREEIKREEKIREEKIREEKKREEKIREEKIREEIKREEKKREEKIREEKIQEEKIREEIKREEKIREEKKREEKKREEKIREEKIREEMKREAKKREEEKQDFSKLKSTSSDLSNQGVHAATVSLTTKAEEEKASQPIRKEEPDRPSGAEANKKGPEEKEAGGDEGMVPPSAVQREYLRRLLKEMCHYCDRYRPGDQAAGLKAFLRDTIETEFLSKEDVGASFLRQADQ